MYSIENFINKQTERHNNRNIELEIPAHIDYIYVTFFNYFTPDLESKYRSRFGLSPVKYELYNEKVLFAIKDTAKFDALLAELRKFIETSDHSQIPLPYDPVIKYIKEFEFLSSEKIIKINEENELLYLNLITNSEVFTDVYLPVSTKLFEYLQNNKLRYFLNRENDTLEIYGLTDETLNIIADNFDIIHTINSFRAGLIRPSRFGTPLRNFGYSIDNNVQAPTVGIIDTGVSTQTPLSSIIINNNEDYNITDSGSSIDNADHGTGIANLVALGKTFYIERNGSYLADNKILSIKILDSTNGYISQRSVIDLIKKGHRDHHIRIFVLTVTHKENLPTNSNMSSYAYLLDKLAFDLDILIILPTGNNSNLVQGINGIVQYPNHFLDETANLCSPSESMNNITVGAIADNFEEDDFTGITPAKEFPAIYTRTYHLDINSSYLGKSQMNNHLFKPDIVMNGGDFDRTLNDSQKPALTILSSQMGIFFEKSIGTSYSAGLCGNLTSKIVSKYPALNMQSVKALIINSSFKEWSDNSIPHPLNQINPKFIKNLIGTGIPNEYKCLNSNENEITMIIEDTIGPDSTKAFPIKIPQYLNTYDRKRSVIDVTATLCFKFDPLYNNHLLYCPIHITFGFFKNIELDSLISEKRSEVIFKNNVTWVEDYYYRGKILSNVQKTKFTVGKDHLIGENNLLKIAINSRIHRLLNSHLRNLYANKRFPYSLVIRITEKPINNTNTGQLYNEMTAINNLENIVTLEAELEVTV